MSHTSAPDEELLSGKRRRSMLPFKIETSVVWRRFRQALPALMTLRIPWPGRRQWNWATALLLCALAGMQIFSPQDVSAQAETRQADSGAAAAVPSLVGLSAAEAKQAVLKAGLEVEFLLGGQPPSQDKGLTVAAQEPQAGAKLAQREPVRITIFSDPGLAPKGHTKVPRLLGGSAADARAALRAHGLVPRFQLGAAAPSQELSLTVFAQTPQPGVTRATGSPVVVTVYAQHSPAGPAILAAADVAELTHVIAGPFRGEGDEQIDPRSGQLWMAVTDLVLPAGPVDLEVARSLQTIQKEPGLLGSRWRLNWEKRVLRNGEFALVEEGAGLTPFEFDSSAGVYRSPGGEQLKFLPDRAVRLLRDGTKEFFGADGRLELRVEPGGVEIALRYDDTGRLSRIEGPVQAFLEFKTDESGRLERVESSSGESVSYFYAGQQPPADESGGPVLSYYYGADGTLVRIERPRSGATEFNYDEAGRVTGRQWADGSREGYRYDDESNTLRHTDPAGNVATMTWSADRLHNEVTDPLGRTTVVDYDQEGRTTEIVGPTGEALSTVYDALGRIASVDNSTTGRTLFEYRDESSRPAAITHWNGERENFEYDEQQRVVRIVRTDDRGTLLLETDFTYLPDGLLRTMKASLGLEFSYTYDNYGHVASITDAAGSRTQFEHDRRGRLLRRIDPLGGVTSYAYDDQSRLTRMIDPTGAVTRYEYSPRGLLARQIDPGEAVTEYAYDERGRLVTSTDPLGRVTRFAYEAGGLKSMTDAAGHTVALERDAVGNVVRTTNPLGGVTTRAFDPLGRLIAQTDPAGGHSRFEYSKAGRLARGTDPAGLTFEFAYDARGRVVAATNPAGRTTRLAYTPRGEVAEVTPAVGPAATYEYDSAGNVLRVIEAGREVVRYEYDVLGRQTKAIWSTGREAEYRYNALGDLVGWSDNLGAGSTMQLDGNSRVTALQDGSGATTRFRYDPAGNLTAVTDPLGRQKRMTYNAAGELTEVVDPSGSRAAFEYDAAGNLAALRHPGGGETKYAYNGLGAVIEVTDPLGNKAQSSYDPAGRLLSTTDAKGQTTTFAYDAAGRTAKKALADGNVVTYEYDERGNLVALDDGAFPVRYEHDADDRLTRIEYPAIGKTLAYEYDERGRLARFIDPQGISSTYEYDPASRLEAIRLDDGQTVAFTYDARDRRTSVRYPNGVKGAWEYDAEDRPTRLTYADASGKTLAGWTYTYDEAGNCIKTVDGGGSSAAEYRYDAGGQLVEEQAPHSARSYAYLSSGNRASLKTAQRTIDYRYDEGDRLLRAGDETFQYDANGNLTERSGPTGATRYTWDAEDRLVKVALPDGEEVAYGYAPTGERIWRKDAEGLTRYVTDGLHVLAELDEDLETRAAYLYGPGVDDALMLLRGEKAFCYHADRIGSVSRITDSSGEVAASYEYDAFGRITRAAGELENDLGFTARRFDPATGLYYYRARYYDPGLGRFLGVDPVAGPVDNTLAQNPYLYVLNNPLRFVDPMGTDPMGPTRLATPVDQFKAEQATLRMLQNDPVRQRLAGAKFRIQGLEAELTGPYRQSLREWGAEAKTAKHAVQGIKKMGSGSPFNAYEDYGASLRRQIAEARIDMRNAELNLPGRSTVPPSGRGPSATVGAGTPSGAGTSGPAVTGGGGPAPTGRITRIQGGQNAAAAAEGVAADAAAARAAAGEVAAGRAAVGEAAAAGGRVAPKIAKGAGLAAAVGLVTNTGADLLEGKGPGEIASDLAEGIANLPGYAKEQAKQGADFIRNIPYVGDLPAVPEMVGGGLAGLKVLVVDPIDAVVTGVGRLGRAVVKQVFAPLAAGHSTRVAAEQDDSPRIGYFRPRKHGHKEGEDVPGDKTEDAPGDKTEDVPRDKTEDAPGDKTEDAPGDKTEDAPGDKTGDVPRDETDDDPRDETDDDDSEIRERAEDAADEFLDNQRIRETATRIADRRERQRQEAIAAAQREAARQAQAAAQQAAIAARQRELERAARAEEAARNIQNIFDAFGRGGWGQGTGRGGRARPGRGHRQQPLRPGRPGRPRPLIVKSRAQDGDNNLTATIGLGGTFPAEARVQESVSYSTT